MSIKKKIVIKLSGEAIYKSVDTINLDYLKHFGQFIAHLTKTWNVALTVGGGHIARQYILAAKHLGLADSKASLIGGDVGLINSRLVIAALTSFGVKTHSTPIEDFSVAEEKLNFGVVPVLFGHWLALTSDSVAVYFADYISANIVLKLSQIDSIYTCDPSIYSHAKPNGRLSYEELEALSIQNDNRVAGEKFVIDLLAAKRLRNSNIPLWLLHMSELDFACKTLSETAKGKTMQGTLIGDISI